LPEEVILPKLCRTYLLCGYEAPSLTQSQEEKRRMKALRLDIYVWPMIIDYRHGTEKLLVRIPLRKKAYEYDD
jgi:hypothetical protein